MKTVFCTMAAEWFGSHKRNIYPSLRLRMASPYVLGAAAAMMT
jgi:hypothetical protein